jgi:acetaldehyde dehydrogenase (acetylating)
MGVVRVAVCQGLDEESEGLDRGERLGKAATNHKDEAIAKE